MLSVLFFLITTVMLVTLMMIMPKNDNELNGTTWLIATINMLVCVWVFGSGIMNMAEWKINLTTLSVLNIVVSIIMLIYIVCKKRKQQYYIKWQDIVVVGAIIAVTLIIALVRYGVKLDMFAYAQDDSVRHFYNTKVFVETDRTNFNRYFLYLFYSVIIRVLDPFIGQVNWYRAFLLGDIFVQIMISTMFWVLIRRYVKDKRSYAFGIVFTFLYALGFPLMNMLCGFEYLGSGILTCTILLWLLDCIEQEEFSWNISLILLMVVNVSVCESYTLFAPAVFVGEVLYFAFTFAKRNDLFSLKTFVLLIVGFIIPGYICVYYVARSYMDILLPYMGIGVATIGVLLLLSNISILKKHKKICYGIWSVSALVGLVLIYKYVLMTIVVGYMKADGSIHRNGYGDFVILLLPVVLFIIRLLREKKVDATVCIMLSQIVFAGWQLYCVCIGKMGSYYFYKNHFLMWLLLFFCAFREICLITGEAGRIMNVYLSIAGIGFMFAVSGVESSWEENSDFTWPLNAGKTLFGVYVENMDMLERGGNVTRDMMTMYQVVRELVETQDTTVLYFGRELRYLKEYYYYLTDQHPSVHKDNLNDGNYPSFDIREDLEKIGAKWIFVDKSYQGTYEAYKEAYDVMWITYENDYGWVLKLD